MDGATSVRCCVSSTIRQVIRQNSPVSIFNGSLQSIVEDENRAWFDSYKLTKVIAENQTHCWGNCTDCQEGDPPPPCLAIWSTIVDHPWIYLANLGIHKTPYGAIRDNFEEDGRRPLGSRRPLAFQQFRLHNFHQFSRQSNAPTLSFGEARP